MIQVTAQTRIRVAIEPVDFRRGIDGLARLCREALREDPFRGTVFVFRNRRATALKILAYDGQGFWLCHKRLSTGRFRHWPRSRDSALEFEAHELAVLVCGGNPTIARGAARWREVKFPA